MSGEALPISVFQEIPRGEYPNCPICGSPTNKKQGKYVFECPNENCMMIEFNARPFVRQVPKRMMEGFLIYEVKLRAECGGPVVRFSQ